MLPFVGVDGEGGEITDELGFSHHEYTMLRAGDRYMLPGEPGTEQWLRFLISLPRRHTYVSYFFDYDVTMMLRTLPEHMLRVLVSGQDIRTDHFAVSYRPRKEFIVRAGGRMVTINDVGTFFQTSFVKALEQWDIGTLAERQRIAEGKELRSSFGALTGETLEYNQLECDKLAELMTKFGRTCEILGYLPSRWQGPGQLAKAMFRKHGIPRTEQLPEPPPGVWEMAQAAYYGGRFETSAVGPVRGPVESWDINSAYPYACTLLPCLVHSAWKHTRASTARLFNHGVYKVSFSHRGGHQTFYGLPVRDRDGSIRFPRNGSGWYWGVELLAAQKLGAEIDVHHGWVIERQCGCKPFDFMIRLDSLRKGMGKTEAGYALKLAMNSAYGVLAQSIGEAPYANPIWAGLITAITRVRLIDALAKNPYDVYMLATDGLFAKAGALNLVESGELGGWERTVYPEGMHIVQPGMYFLGHKDGCSGVDCKCRPKTRGVPMSAIEREETALKKAWNGTAGSEHPIELRQFIGLRLGLARDAYPTLGEWLPVTKYVSYDWRTKRRPVSVIRAPEGLRTKPYVGEYDQWTTPYHRMIGGNLIRSLDRLEFADQPDWEESFTENI